MIILKEEPMKEEMEKEWDRCATPLGTGTLAGEMIAQSEFSKWARKYGPNLLIIVKAAHRYLLVLDLYADSSEAENALREAMSDLEDLER